jgi:hypothetical protein
VEHTAAAGVLDARIVIDPPAGLFEVQARPPPKPDKAP